MSITNVIVFYLHMTMHTHKDLKIPFPHNLFFFWQEIRKQAKEHNWSNAKYCSESSVALLRGSSNEDWKNIGGVLMKTMG